MNVKVLKMKSMKRLIMVFVAVAGLALVAPGAQYEVDQSRSSVKWNGKKVTGEHYGTIGLKSGTLEVKNNTISAATMVMDMQAIVCEDLTDAGINARLVGHLKSDDFFSVEKFPVSSFLLTKVVKVAGNEYDFTGNLTIKGITHPVTFRATAVTEGDLLRSSGKIVVNRAKYDVKYGSGSFFSGLGDKMIYDDFTLDFSLVAKKK
jgi:polyisoprenoid-binding protein YceI